MTRDIKISFSSDTSMFVEMGQAIDLDVNRKVIEIADSLREARIRGVRDIVPTFRSVLIEFDPEYADPVYLEQAVVGFVNQPASCESRKTKWTLPICYDEEVALDIRWISENANLSTNEVSVLHSESTYHIYMIGFLPGQAYIGNVASSLQVSRMRAPRPLISSGCVCISGSVCSIFPRETPCGWRIVGRCPLDLVSAHSTGCFRPGDSITFIPISIQEYTDLNGRSMGHFPHEWNLCQ